MQSANIPKFLENFKALTGLKMSGCTDLIFR